MVVSWNTGTLPSSSSSDWGFLLTKTIRFGIPRSMETMRNSEDWRSASRHQATGPLGSFSAHPCWLMRWKLGASWPFWRIFLELDGIGPFLLISCHDKQETLLRSLRLERLPLKVIKYTHTQWIEATAKKNSMERGWTQKICEDWERAAFMANMLQNLESKFQLQSSKNLQPFQWTTRTFSQSNWLETWLIIGPSVRGRKGSL